MYQYAMTTPGKGHRHASPGNSGSSGGSSGGPASPRREGHGRHRFSEPTEEERRFAAQFARWQKEAREMRGWSMLRLAEKCEWSASQVRLMDEDSKGGMDDTGRYRRPSEAYIEAVAKATGAQIAAGRIAAGYDRPLPDITKDARSYQLSTGDWVQVREDDPEPDLTLAAAEAFFRTLRLNLHPRRASPAAVRETPETYPGYAEKKTDEEEG